ncbi:hypothetical protein [Saccharopolyspora gloriosae]|uniref:hypothetical protein n=1 Tax=Saccharopolyspora gloriosae TaxID=455344 RepID=UPI001FB59A2B|nr:hypothetical protein [Saccharopolyspora gloriosae]
MTDCPDLLTGLYDLVRLDEDEDDPISARWSFGSLRLDGTLDAAATRSASHHPDDPQQRIESDRIAGWLAEVLDASGVQLCPVGDARYPSWWVVAWND